MPKSSIEVTLVSQVAVIWLDRQEVRNAMDAAMVGALDAALSKLDADNSVRAVVIASRGQAFCSGIDLRWMRRMGRSTLGVNTGDAQALARLLQRLDSLGKPTIARVQGAAYGGGLGLIAACDIAVAALDADFCLSETRLGLAPATIAPYLVRAIGERQARRYLVSGEHFTAAEAYRIGLVHELAPPETLDERINEILGNFQLLGPKAVYAAKQNIAQVSGTHISPEIISAMASRAAVLRASEEGQEGINAFLEKRAPSWVTKGNKGSERSNRPRKARAKS